MKNWKIARYSLLAGPGCCYIDIIDDDNHIMLSVRGHGKADATERAHEVLRRIKAAAPENDVTNFCPECARRRWGEK